MRCRFISSTASAMVTVADTAYTAEPLRSNKAEIGVFMEEYFRGVGSIMVWPGGPAT